MSLTTAQLTTEYTNVNEGAAPDAATQLLIAAYAQQTIGGGITDAAALSLALHSTEGVSGGAPIANTPEDSTDVALATYQFFTGMAPTLDGLDYLVGNDGGAPLNPNDLDSAYYGAFNQANRYYNFAINLITGNPAAAAAFQTNYGSVTFNQAVTGAYLQIVGSNNPTAIAAIEAQLSYFQQVAAERAPNVNQDLATKAIMIGYILEEAVKADVGAYAVAIDQFNALLATNPEAVIPGETANGIDLLTAFPISPVGQTFTLTPGVDVITPPATDNNTVVGTELTLTSFDNVDLGATTGNTLVWTDAVDTSGFVFAVPIAVTVNGVQTADFNSLTGTEINVQGWTGLQTLNVTSFVTGGSGDADIIFVDPGVAVNVVENLAAYNSGNGLEVNGGSVVTVTANNGHFGSSEGITVNGDASTTTVVVNQTVTTGSDQDVSVNDYYATIANVTMNGFVDTNLFVDDSGGVGVGLANLTLQNAADSDVFIDAATGSPAALNVTMTNADDIFLDDEFSTYTALNVTANTSVTGFDPDMNGITVETVTGDTVLEQDSWSFYLGALGSIIITGGAGFLDDNQGLVDLPSLTSFDASASSGAITVFLNAAQTSFLGGAGTDFVEIYTDAQVLITGGTATNNEIVLNFATPGISTYANISEFQILGTDFDSAGTYNLQGFSAPAQIASVDVLSDPAGALFFTHSASNQTLTVEGGITLHSPITFTQGAGAAASSHNVFNLVLGPDTDTSNISSGSSGLVGTDTPVAAHTGGTTTVVHDTLGTGETPWTDAIDLTNGKNGGQVSVDITSNGGDTVTVNFTTSSATNNAKALAAAINADATDSTLVHATVSGSTVTLTSLVDGTAGNQTDIVSVANGQTVSDTVTLGVNGTASTGTIQVTATDATNPNELTFSDSAGALAGFVAVTAGESDAAVASAIDSLLVSDGFTGVSVSPSDTVNFTYPGGESGLTATDTVAQVDDISLAGVTVSNGDIFSETVNGSTVTYTATGADTATTVAAGLAAAINTVTGTTTVTASASGTDILLTEVTGDASLSFTSTQVTQESFGGAIGTNAITAENYQTLNIDTKSIITDLNTSYFVDAALATLVITDGGSLNLATSGGTALATIDTSGATGDLNLFGVGQSEVTTGITATLGDANVGLFGNADTGSTDVINGGNGSDQIVGTGNGTTAGSGGNTDVALGDGTDLVILYSGTHNVVSLGNGVGDVVQDTSNGADSISLGNGNGDIVLLTGTGNSTVTLGNGAGDIVVDAGSGNNVIHVGNGAGDIVVTGSGMDTVVVGTGSGDIVQVQDDLGNGSGIANVTFGGALATLDLDNLVTASFATPTTSAEPSILTNNLNVVNGLVHGDTIVLPTSGDTLHTAINMAGVAGEVVLTTGTESGGVFTYGAAGHDALLTYDSGSGAFVSVVVVGGAAEISHATLSGDAITW